MKSSKQHISKCYRIALVGIYHESNTFNAQPTTMEDFQCGEWLTGNDMLDSCHSNCYEIAGMMEVLGGEEFELLPLFFAGAAPGGAIDANASEALISTMFTRLGEVLPIDGCFVVAHGAAVSETYPDMDGRWLYLLREKLGREVPIIGTLAHNANVSRTMVEATDALVASRRNSSIDRRKVGKEAAGLLIKCLKGMIKPFQYLLPLPLAVSIELQDSSREPVRSLCKYADYIKDIKGILSASIFLGFQYADVEDMGSSFLIVSDGLHEDANDALDGLLALLELMKNRFLTPKLSINSQLPLIAASKKPVLLLDMGDNVEAGSPGASTFLLKALEDYGNYTSFICICDPEAVTEAMKYEKGDTFYLSFGRRQESDGKSFVTNVWLLDIVDGRFSEVPPDQETNVTYNMGKTVVLLTQQGNTVMLTSLRMSAFSVRQLTTFGIMPGDFDVVIAKGVHKATQAYRAVCHTIIPVDTPGATRADITKLSYKNRRKPIFPFE